MARSSIAQHARGGRNATRIDGLAEFQRALRAAGADWAKELRAQNKAAAAEVVEGGKRELTSTGHPVLRHVAGLKALKAKGESRYAVVVIDARAKRNAMALGAELGSEAYRQFPAYNEAAWRQGLPTGGYGAHEAIREDIDDIRDGYGDRLESLYRQAFPS